ncbi:MAG: hypothetical protein AAF490_23035 [Chloroflexota bacterium]
MSDNWLTDWDNPHDILDCDNCDATYLHPKHQTDMVCPLCGETSFTEVALNEDAVLNIQPEYLVSFRQSKEALQTQLATFRRSLRLPPKDCTVENLTARAMPFYWPMWLVDNDVTARWQAEVGFDYDAVTYQEQYVEGEWRSRQNRERRVRWEQRLGVLTRHYADHPAPALDEHWAILRLMGKYDLGSKRPFNPQHVSDQLIRLPVRTTADAWPDVEPRLLKSATIECQAAASAQHIRHFKWSPQFANANWTQLLLPMTVTYYLDDTGKKRMVYLQGQTGKLVGQRRASMQRAFQFSRRAIVAAGLLGLITAVLWLVQSFTTVELSNVVDLLLTPIFLIMLVAFIPPIGVAYLNNSHFALENHEIKSSLHQSAKAYWEEND